MTPPILEFSYTDTVRYRDCDLHGHLNHACYFTFMEQARTEYLRAIGLTPTGDRHTIPFIVAHASCDYRAIAELGDAIVTAMGVVRIGTTSIEMRYVMSRATDQTLLADATTIMVHFDYHTGQPAPVPAPLRVRINTLKQQAGVVPLTLPSAGL